MAGALVMYQQSSSKSGSSACKLVSTTLPATGLTGAACCSFRDQFVISGGAPVEPTFESIDQFESWESKYSNASVDMWSIATRRWTSRSPMNQARAKHQLLDVGGELWAMGGISSSEPQLEPKSNGKWRSTKFQSNTLDSIEVYNSRTDTWCSGISLPKQMHSFGSANCIGAAVMQL